MQNTSDIFFTLKGINYFTEKSTDWKNLKGKPSTYNVHLPSLHSGWKLQSNYRGKGLRLG